MRLHIKIAILGIKRKTLIHLEFITHTCYWHGHNPSQYNVPEQGPINNFFGPHPSDHNNRTDFTVGGTDRNTQV